MSPGWSAFDLSVCSSLTAHCRPRRRSLDLLGHKDRKVRRALTGHKDRKATLDLSDPRALTARKDRKATLGLRALTDLQGRVRGRMASAM
jgi:hypothetical protein